MTCFDSYGLPMPIGVARAWQSRHNKTKDRQMNAVATPAQATMFGILDQTISKVFGSKEIKNGKGDNVGVSITTMGRKDIAKALGLTMSKDDRELLDDAILESSDKAFAKAKAELVGLNGEWTMKRLSSRTMGNGERQISLVVREVKRTKGLPSDEAIAKALGITVEEVATMRARQQAALARPAIEVKP